MDTEPQTKSERRRNRALTRFAALVYRHMRLQSRRVDRMSVQVESLQDRVAELVGELQVIAQSIVEVRNRALSAIALYHDTHDSITGEHINGGVFDVNNAQWIEPRALPGTNDEPITEVIDAVDVNAPENEDYAAYLDRTQPSND
jgi:hypothetical protein